VWRIVNFPQKSAIRHRQVRIAAEQADASALDGERKTVTALFADIKGSTELEQDLDPEEARSIVDPALKLMIDAVRRYDARLISRTKRAEVHQGPGAYPGILLRDQGIS
jgi:class 3 adenylate cyclase